MPDLRAKLMTLIHLLRHPHEKPVDVEILDRRLDEVDRRLEDERRRRMLQDNVDAVRRSGA